MSEALPPELAGLRTEIEAIDRNILELISRRVDAARSVGRAKRAGNLPILDPAREAAVVRRAVELAREHMLDEESVRQVFWHIIGLCRRAQLEGHSEQDA